MIRGMSIASFTTLHVIISVVGIVSGVIALIAMLNGRAPAGWTALFLTTTVLTSVTGFLFPSTGFTPAQAVGALSLVRPRRPFNRQLLRQRVAPPPSARH